MNDSSNFKKGDDFERQVLEYFEEKYKREFTRQKRIAIGNPPKAHKFDIADKENSFAIECKNFTWTSTSNVPSAKLEGCNEAVFYLSFLPESCQKFLVMMKARRAQTGETLAQYYHRMNHHLLRGVKVAEYDPKTHILEVIETTLM